ncbi:hypothetical protein ASPZODRAFT_24079 [Penicilliopsis zonata CBS 506.65]|uniref:F-box domain-containing protein n=1 Tax=Penicilliopsis zonata CBS 506.65 TaxID=1073090 RepID=A0A1L9SMN2_9EURO|nr:hypothetical protein ASPZODRAFT_24079 [Penicilliopsis zonata CBS 506.65]OJJ48448.1 hypothetical protein ASPZODRAFT_24079 [Penicilliopsis zonata CBS 506.65]
MTNALLDLPNELLHAIAAQLAEADLNALHQTNRRLFRLLDAYRDRFNAQQHEGSAPVLGRSTRPRGRSSQIHHGGATPLEIAVSRGDASMVKTLLECRAYSSREEEARGMAVVAAAKGHVDVLHVLIEHCGKTQAVIEHRESIWGDALNTGGFTVTPLLTAVEHGHVHVAKVLLQEYGADIEARGWQGKTLPPLVHGGREGVSRTGAASSGSGSKMWTCWWPDRRCSTPRSTGSSTWSSFFCSSVARGRATAAAGRGRRRFTTRCVRADGISSAYSCSNRNKREMRLFPILAVCTMPSRTGRRSTTSPACCWNTGRAQNTGDLLALTVRRRLPATAAELLLDYGAEGDVYTRGGRPFFLVAMGLRYWGGGGEAQKESTKY